MKKLLLCALLLAGCADEPRYRWVESKTPPPWFFAFAERVDPSAPVDSANTTYITNAVFFYREAVEAPDGRIEAVEVRR